MILNIQRLERYSRGDLLLRAFFGGIYIAIPHGFLLAILGIWAQIQGFIAFWLILFTGRYPESMFEYQVKYMRYSLRVNARFMNLLEGMPEFGLDAEDPNVQFQVPYPTEIDKTSVLIRALFGFFYVTIPHMFMLFFRMLVQVYYHNLVIFFSILFNESIPEASFEYTVATQRWIHRLQLYQLYMTNEYPPFNGQP